MDDKDRDPHDKWIGLIKWLATGYVKLVAIILAATLIPMALFGCCLMIFWGGFIGVAALPGPQPAFPTSLGGLPTQPYQTAPHPLATQSFPTGTPKRAP